MQIGVDSYAYHRLLGEMRPGESDPGERLRDGAVAVIDEAHTLGVDAVSLETCFLNSRDELRKSAVWAEERSLELVLAWGAPNGLEFGRNKGALLDMLEWIVLAGELKMAIVRVVVGGPAIRARSHEWRGAIEPLRRAARCAHEAGVRLALENHGDLRTEEIEKLLNAVGHEALGVCFDTANALRVGDDVVEAARRLASSVWMVHLKDVAPIVEGDDPVAGPRSVGYGRGVIPLEGVLSAVGGPTFDGIVFVELGQLHVDADEQALVAECVAWLQAYRTRAAEAIA